ncbi:MAG: MFS transporter [Candidatus Bathyarchaeota archaeon]|nr:MAG: MFS transporter [Candidatus Bathyarchaeota archaeon]
MDAEASDRLESKSMTKFSVIFAGQAFSLFGSRLVQFALVWWLTSTSGLASTLALASIMALIPQVLLGPFAGTLVDRWNRRRVMIVADALIALVVVTLGLLYALGVVKIWNIFAAMFLRSLLGAFHWPAMQTTTTMIVPEKHLSRVAGLNQSLQGLVNIVAPPLGAILLGFLPIQTILYIDVSTAALAVATLLFVSLPQPVIPEGKQRGWRSVLSDMREGMRFVWEWKGLRLIMMISMIINLLVNPGFALLPILVTKHFGGGALELAWMQSAMGIGMILGGLTLGVWGGFRKRVVTAFSAIVVSGIFVIAIGVMPAHLFLYAVGSMFCFAFLNAIANGTFFASMQSIVPPEIQGRVFTLLMSLSAGMVPLGMAVAGPVADAFGERIWFVVGGITFIILGIAAFFIPSIMNVEEEGTGNSPVGETLDT